MWCVECTKTVKQLFNDTDYSNTNKDNMRMDLITTQPFIPGNPKLLIDVSVVQSYPGTNNTGRTTNNLNPNIWLNIDKMPQNRMATKAANAKKKKYDEDQLNKNQNYNQVFMPFIQEVNGYLEKEGYEFINQLANKAATTKEIPAANLRIYFLNLLSFNLQKSLFYSIKVHLHQSSARHSPQLSVNGDKENAESEDAHINTLIDSPLSSPDINGDYFADIGENFVNF